MGLFDFLFGNSDDESGTKTVFSSGQDRNDGGFRQDKYVIDKTDDSKEHTFSKTSQDGEEHIEGWHGKNSET